MIAVKGGHMDEEWGEGGGVGGEGRGERRERGGGYE